MQTVLPLMALLSARRIRWLFFTALLLHPHVSLEPKANCVLHCTLRTSTEQTNLSLARAHTYTQALGNSLRSARFFPPKRKILSHTAPAFPLAQLSQPACAYLGASRFLNDGGKPIAGSYRCTAVDRHWERKPVRLYRRDVHSSAAGIWNILIPTTYSVGRFSTLSK